MNIKNLKEKIKNLEDIGINIDELEILVKIGDAILLPLELSTDLDDNLYSARDIIFINKKHLIPQH